MTLVKLEQSPNTYQTRYSFMFPKVGRGKKFACKQLLDDQVPCIEHVTLQFMIVFDVTNVVTSVTPVVVTL